MSKLIANMVYAVVRMYEAEDLEGVVTFLDNLHPQVRDDLIDALPDDIIETFAKDCFEYLDAKEAAEAIHRAQAEQQKYVPWGYLDPRITCVWRDAKGIWYGSEDFPLFIPEHNDYIVGGEYWNLDACIADSGIIKDTADALLFRPTDS